jgi:hypothetical protein
MLSKEMDARAQDARQLTSDGQKLMDTFLFELIPAFKELILGGLTVLSLEISGPGWAPRAIEAQL